MAEERAVPPKRVALVGVPMDLGGGRRGVDMGPSAVRIADIDHAVRAMGLEFEDHGNLPVSQPETCEPKDPRARFLGAIADCCAELRRKVQGLLEEGRFPLVVGGDHSIACGTVAGVSSYYHARGEKIGLIWFDAHGDMNTPTTTRSGNIHGMPLAACIGRGPEPLTRLGDRVPMVDVANCVLVGVRSLDAGERELIHETGIRCITMKEIDLRGIHPVMRDAIERATDGTAGFHLSFDMDGTDPSVAPGVGTPVPGGVSYREAHAVMELVAETHKVLGLEIAEINPILDSVNSTARMAVEFATSALGKLIL